MQSLQESLPQDLPVLAKNLDLEEVTVFPWLNSGLPLLCLLPANLALQATHVNGCFSSTKIHREDKPSSVSSPEAPQRARASRFILVCVWKSEDHAECLPLWVSMSETGSLIGPGAHRVTYLAGQHAPGSLMPLLI